MTGMSNFRECIVKPVHIDVDAAGLYCDKRTESDSNVLEAFLY